MSAFESPATLTVGGASHELVSVTGHEAASELFTYEVTWRAPLPVADPSELVGAEATLTLDDRAGHVRVVAGVVGRAEGSATDFEFADVRLALRPKTFGLTLGRSSRTFQSLSLVALLSEVLGAHAGDTTFAFERSGTIPYRVQRGESDWAFIERTLHDAGLLYWFDHEAGSRLVIADKLDRGTFLEGRGMPLHLGSIVDKVPEGILSLARTGAAATTQHSMKGFRWEKPTFGVAATAGGGRYESYDRVLEVPGLREIGPGLASQAKARASTGRISGTARTVRLYPGVSFAIDGDAGGEHAVTEIDVRMAPKSEQEPSQAVVIAFAAAPRGDAVLPAAPAPPRTHAGLSFAIISADAGDEVYPEEKGQVRAQHHWDRGGAFDASSGTWLRPTQRVAPASMMFPRTGWVVASMGQCGEGDAPISLGRIHDGDHPPSYALPEHKTRVVYKTATTPGGGSFNEIHFEDKKGAEVMFIHASKNTDILTKNYKAEHVENDASHTVDGEQAFTHGADVKTKVDLSQSIEIGHDEIVKVGKDESKTVKGNETISIGGSRKIHGKAGHSTTARLARKLKVGAALIDVSLGQINRSAKNAMTLVGGAIVRLSGQTLSRQVGPVWFEAVGGLKYAKSGHTLSDSAAKDFSETVGGSVTLDAGIHVSEDSDAASEWTVAGKLSGSADEAMVEAHDAIEIVCGRSILRLDPKSLTLSSTEIELAGGAIEVLSGLIVHN